MKECQSLGGQLFSGDHILKSLLNDAGLQKFHHPASFARREIVSISGIQGLPLEVTVVGCVNLKDTEWISRQDPYVRHEYAGSKFRTKTCTDGGRNPIFQEKFVLALIEGLRELNVMVWNSNTLSADDFIGSGRIQLYKVLSQGYDGTAWPVQDKCGRYSGEARLILYSSATHQSKPKAQSSALLCGTPKPTRPGILPYVQTTASPYRTPSPYAAALAYPPASTAYPPCAYPPPPTYSAYPLTSSTYPPPPAYPPPQAGYPACTPAGYPPQYPPPASRRYPPGPAAGIYPPPPY